MRAPNCILGLPFILIATSAGHAEEGLVVDVQSVLNISETGQHATYRLKEMREKKKASPEALAAAQQDEVKLILQRVEPVIAGWARKEKLAIVFNKQGVVYRSADMDTTLDLTRVLDGNRDDGFRRRGEYSDLGLRVAVVDMTRAMKTSKTGMAKIAKLGADVAKQQATLDAGAAKLRDIMARADKLEKDSPEWEANKKEATLEMKRLNTLKEMWDYEGNFFQNAAIDEMTQRLDAVVAVVARRDGFTVVLDRDGFGVLYADANLDLTDDAIRIFDAGPELPKVEPGKPRPLSKLRFVDIARLEKAYTEATGADLKNPKAGDKFKLDVARSTERLAKEGGLNLVFTLRPAPLEYGRPDLDVTAQVIAAVAPPRKK